MINIKYLTRISFHHYRLNLFYLQSFKYIDTNWLTFNGLIKLTILLALSKIFSFIRTLQSKTERFSLKNYYKVPYINVCYCFLFNINIFIYYISTSCQLWFVFLFVYFPIFLELYSHRLQNYTYYVVCEKKTNYTNKDMFFAIDAFLSIFRLNENSIFQFFSL